MKAENINISVPVKILVAPLDWGLGHATRCIPIIKELTRQGADVIIAAGKKTKPLLQPEFPGHTFIQIEDYAIQYGSRGSLILKLMSQLPRVNKTIKSENRWLKKIIREYGISAVISDNRFGLYNSSVPCIYITHQLEFKTNNRVINWLMQAVHYRFINNFNECWIPDDENVQLSGKMSRPRKRPSIPVQFIGPLSRLSLLKEEKIYAFLFLLSGPEPQRTILESIILREFSNFEKPFAIVRGLPGNKLPLKYHNKNALITAHLDSMSLSKLISQSNVVISRSGYSTVMDLSKLGSRAIFVPTPGQAEQEYLAEYLKSKNYCETILQRDISLEKILDLNSREFKFPLQPVPNVLEKIVSEFLTRFQNR